MQKLNLEEIQKIELDILIYLDKICKENNIKYYLSSGTLLGAIKYKGFIPWDDDIDVVLFRSDYLKLIDVLGKNDEKYKILSIYNTEDYYYPFAKLVDTRTVLIENSKKIKEMGVYIDIFPIDGYITENIEKEISQLRILRNLMVRRYRIKNCIRNNFDYIIDGKTNVKHKKIKDIIYGFIDYITLPLGYNFYTKLFDKKISSVNANDSKYIGVRVGNFGFKEAFLKKDIIEQDIYEFEGHKFTSFKNYDLYLNSKYGDYKKEPDISQRKSHHQNDVYYK